MDNRKQEILNDIVAARTEVLRAVSSLGPQQMARPTSNEGWSVQDLLAHLSSIEARLRSMWQHALDGREWPANDASVDAYNDRCVAERRSWSSQAILDEFEESGHETLSFVERLKPSDLDMTFNHPTRGVVTIESLLRIIPRHLREHGQQIREAVGTS